MISAVSGTPMHYYYGKVGCGGIQKKIRGCYWGAHMQLLLRWSLLHSHKKHTNKNPSPNLIICQIFARAFQQHRQKWKTTSNRRLILYTVFAMACDKHIQTVRKTKYHPSFGPTLSQPDSINIHKLLRPSRVEISFLVYSGSVYPCYMWPLS